MATKKILAVDDEEDILELLTFNLSREGYRVVSAATGEAALKAVPKEIPDLIILDLMLPGIDGLEVARRLKNDPNTKGIPIISPEDRGGSLPGPRSLMRSGEMTILSPIAP